LLIAHSHGTKLPVHISNSHFTTYLKKYQSQESYTSKSIPLLIAFFHIHLGPGGCALPEKIKKKSKKKKKKKKGRGVMGCGANAYFSTQK
jgi:hypothetical protein